MNPSDWIKAATLVTQNKQDAAMAETDQLSSIPLSQIAMDDSGPPIVHYGMHVPIAVSTPTGTDVHMHSSQQLFNPLKGRDQNNQKSEAEEKANSLSKN